MPHKLFKWLIGILLKPFILAGYLSGVVRDKTLEPFKNVSRPAVFRRFSRILNYLFCIVALLFIVYDFFYLIDAPLNLAGKIRIGVMVYSFLFVSLCFFIAVICTVLFLYSNKKEFSAKQLTLDSIESTISCIISFSLAYRFHGYGVFVEGACIVPDQTLESLYFSAVTFSTLGYGDLLPCGLSRMLAPVQALLGNLHLALIIGGVFLVSSALPIEENAVAEKNNE